MSRCKESFFLVFVLMVSTTISSHHHHHNSEFNPTSAVNSLEDSWSGWDIGYHNFINILTRHNYEQRLAIREEYRRIYGKDLVNKLIRMSHGSFEYGLIGLFMNSLELGALFVTRSLEVKCSVDPFVCDSWVKDRDELFTVLLSLDNGEMPLFRNVYEKGMYEKFDLSRVLFVDEGYPLEEDFNSVIEDFDVKSFLEILVRLDRGRWNTVEDYLAEDDAMHLARQSGMELLTEDFINLFASESNPQLNRTFQLYRHKTGEDIRDYIQERFKEPLSKILRFVVTMATDPVSYYSDWLFEALNRSKVNENILTWVLITRSEKDLPEIRKRYEKEHGSLLNAIKTETTGNYRDLLEAVLKYYSN